MLLTVPESTSFLSTTAHAAHCGLGGRAGIAHDTADSYELILPFMAEMYAARYPADASPQTDAVNLTPVNEADGG